MVKSTAQDRTADAPAYPYLGKAMESGLIVLFTRVGHGVVMVANDRYRLGHFSSMWSLDTFEPFHGTVTLES